MTRIAAARTLPLALFTAAAVACTAGVWAYPGIPGTQSMEMAAAANAPEAASVQPPSGTGGPSADHAKNPPNDEAAHRRLMLLMLIERVRKIGLFGRLGQ